jgi:glycosyltransferase involved in cell wall biosynthesis
MEDSIFLCHKKDYQYFEEYIKCLTDSPFIYDETTLPFEEPKNLMCVRRVPTNLISKGSTVGFINTEQLNNPEKLKEYNLFVSEATLIFDISEENIKISGKGTHLPYKEIPEETTQLKSFLNVKKNYDIAVVGSTSDHRTKYVNTLRQNGFKVDYINNVFGEARDKRIGACSILVNVHYNNSAGIYESIRCERWRYAGMSIISEECLKNPDGVQIVNMKTLIKKLTKALPDRIPNFKIGLCMIVKNESHIVHEALESTVGIIDTFCILDTGSTDNTVKIIRDFYEKAGIDGTVHEGTWKGFGPSRTESLELCNGKMDYIIVIDADDLMGFPPDGKKFLLNVLHSARPNSCNIQIKRGTLEYERTQIFKANDNWKYVGILHEYPTNGNPNNVIVRLPNEIYMVGRTLGARTKEAGNKYKKDADELLVALQSEPENERYMFYLAQSYRDCGMYPESIEWYTKRYNAGKWAEERFISALNLTRLTGLKEWAWKAHELSPIRSESIVAYVTACRMKREINHEVLSMILYASSIQRPTGTILFLEIDNYEWRVWDELAMIAIFLGKREIAKMACTKLLKDGKLPAEHTERIKLIFKHSIGAVTQ